MYYHIMEGLVYVEEMAKFTWMNKKVYVVTKEKVYGYKVTYWLVRSEFMIQETWL